MFVILLQFGVYTIFLTYNPFAKDAKICALVKFLIEELSTLFLRREHGNLSIHASRSSKEHTPNLLWINTQCSG